MEHATIKTDGPKINVKGYGASGSLIGGKTLTPMEIERALPKADEVMIEVLYCGVCHSDIHQVANDWKNTIYPCVPGHEVIGRISQLGSSVTEFNVGEYVGIGCLINSCQSCPSCLEHEEQFCVGPVGATMTYNGYWKPDGTGFNTYGGYSTHLAANKSFVIRIPENLDITAAAPILCAGVTTYSPLKRAGVKAGSKVGIIGIGGLGHMGVMIAKALGATVTAITRKQEKHADALALGADDVLVSEDDEAMKLYEHTFDFMLCTIPYDFDVNPFVKLLGNRGSLVTVGLLGPYKKPTDNMEVAKYGRSVGASLIGGIQETQEVIDFCADHGILPHVQMIRMEDINEAFDRIRDEEVRFRFVIDMQSLK